MNSENRGNWLTKFRGFGKFAARKKGWRSCLSKGQGRRKFFGGKGGWTGGFLSYLSNCLLWLGVEWLCGRPRMYLLGCCIM